MIDSARGTPRQTALWILWVVFVSTTRGDVHCPEGGKVDLDSLHCFWFSEKSSSWFEAQDSCRETRGGKLASVQSEEMQNFIHYHFKKETTVWIWLSGLSGEEPDQLGVVEAQRWDKKRASLGLCPQMALGTPGRWRRAPCDGQYCFICDNQDLSSLPSLENYLTGLVLMTGVYTHTQIQPLPSAPETGQRTVEMLLFPGLWFSHAGQLLSVELVVQPSPISSLARVQILRPYCSPNHHLVPPGCSSLLNPFSCCSSQPLCNTTGGCGVGQYWCHLLEACVPNTRPCSPYNAAILRRGFTLPPRYPALPPFYHLVADLPLSIKPSSELKTLNILLPERPITVYPDDIVAVQHTLDSGTFLHCLNGEASINSPWRQSYLSIRREEWGGWWEGGLTSLPQGSKWVDEVVCDLRILSEDNVHRAAEQEGVFDSTDTQATTASDIRSLTSGPVLGSNFTVNIVYPPPDEKNQIHVEINVPGIVVVEALVGEEATSSWSAPILQTGVPFHVFCPEEVLQSVPDCRTTSRDSRFSSVMLALLSPGVQTLNVSVTDADRFQSLSVEVHGYEAAMGLSVEPRECRRTLIRTSQTFTAKVESGSSVRFTWMIDNLEKSAHEGESYSITFEEPAEYNLQVTASNPISSQSLQILLTADEKTTLTEPEFLFFREVVAVNITHLYTVRVKVDISLPTTFKWDFGDESEDVIHTHSSPCQIMGGLVENGDKQTYVQDSVNHSYSILGNYTLQVLVSDQFVNSSSAIKISVRSQLTSLLISPLTLAPLVKKPLHLEASIKPSTFAVIYTWDFGDASKLVRGFHQKVSHIFESAGVYNVTVSASNSVTSLTASLVVAVMEKISGLTVAHSGLSEAGEPAHFTAKVTTGTSLVWNFDFGDGSLQENLPDGSLSHIYRFPGSYRVTVSVSNSDSQAHQSTAIEVYSLTVSGVLPTECVTSGKNEQLTALVNGNISTLSFHWVFGQDSPSIVIAGQSTVTHTFTSHGTFYINLTVSSSFTSVSFNTSVCVESPIINVDFQISRHVAAVGEQVCLRALVFPEQNTGYQFVWFSSSSGLVTATGNSENNCFVFRREGVEEVSVIASNRVSNKTAKANITIQKPVSKLVITHDSQSNALTVNTSVLFWVASCFGSNVSVLWEFGDGSPVEKSQNVSHVFISTGKFTVNATAFNSVSRDSAVLTVNVLLPVSDLSLHANRSYAVVGQEIVITAVTGDISSADYYWTVEGDSTTQQGTNQFHFISSKPGMFQVKVLAQNLVSKKEAATLIEVFERIEGLLIECPNITDKKYIPTQEKMLFIASVTKGSNITYHWLATQSGINRQIRGDGEAFIVMVETPGRIKVQLKASNILDEAVSSISLVAVEHVTGAHIAAQSNIVALGKAINVSVFVDAGSDLQYRWYVNDHYSPLVTDVPFFLCALTNLGHNLVTVSVQNVFSQSNDTKQFLVQDEVQGADFQISGKKHSFSVNVTASIIFHGFAQNGSDLRWNWKVSSAKELLFTSTNQSFSYRFPHTGICQVYLNVSNEINWQMVSHSVTVQEPVEGLLLNISRTSLCTLEQIVFIPTITKGSNVSFVMTFQNKDRIQTQDIFEGQIVTSSLPAGKHLVTVKALNQVSSAETSSSVAVTESIQGLHLVNCCFATLEALKGVSFMAKVQSGVPVNYTWTFQLENSRPMWLVGQEVIFTQSESGLLSVTVRASNGVCSQTIHETLTIEWPVKEVKLVCHSQRVLVGHGVEFSATVSDRNHMRYSWDFGDSSKVLTTDSRAVGHTYYYAGKYSVVVKAFNNVSHVSTQIDVKVEELQCLHPQVCLIQSQPVIFRSRQNFFEAIVNINCSAYKTTYMWEIFRGMCLTNGTKVVLRSQKAAALPFLILPKHSLDVGHHCLVFTVSYQGTPILVQEKTNISVIHSPLVADIKGGSSRLWTSASDLVLDGSQSHDPDIEPGVEDALQYHWAVFTKNSTESPLVKQPIESTNRSMTILHNQLRLGATYIFILTVHKNRRRPVSVNQTVTVTEAQVFPVTAKCVSCSVVSFVHHISYTNPLVLGGQCGQCDDQAQYNWRAEDQSGLTLDLSGITTSTGTHSPNLVVRSGVLQPGWSYSFNLTVSQPGSRQWGSTSLTIRASSPLQGGACDLSPETNVRLLETVVTYNCSGWYGDENKASQLIYTFQVAPCQSFSTSCPVLTLYRGTRSTFSSLVPMGSPGEQKNTSVITVTLMIEDHLGSKVTAINKTLTVEIPLRDNTDSQWLRIKSQTELWTLVQHGNPQEILPYSIAFISKLNQIKDEGTAEELMERREIRENVTQALVSVPVSSLQDVDQLSSALTQATVVPSELVSESCQKRLLEAVGEMIHVIDRDISPADLPAVDLGRNILSVIGNTLAAVSESDRASSSHPAHSSTLQAASVVVAALGHAGALARTLMRSRVLGQPPLSFANNYINMIGFRGDPFDLLCSHQSNKSNGNSIELPQSSSAEESKSSHSCPFLLPTSLIAQLKSRSCEVVQVLLGMDGTLEPNPLLSAADPPISTAVVAMELTTPQGQPIPIQNLNPKQAIRVTLPNKYPVTQGSVGENGRVSEDKHGRCPTITLPNEGQLNFMVKALDDFHENAGLYISFNFSLAPGATPVSVGHVKIEVNLAAPATNVSQDSLVRERALTLSVVTTSSEETIFLSPHLNRTNQPLSVNLTSCLNDSGPVRVSVCVFSSLCQYYDVKDRRWSSEGLRSLEGSTLRTAHCLTQHLTMFGASLFVHPGAFVLLPPAEGPMRNMVAGIVCAVLVVLHLLVGLIAHKLDHLDSLKLSQVPLCGQPGLYHYRVVVKTGMRPGAGTTAHVGISLFGVSKSGSHHLQQNGAFQRGSLDQFQVETDDNLGEIWKIRIWHDNTGLDPAWYVQHVVVWDAQTDHMFFFLLEDWLSVENQKNRTVEREVLSSCPEELTQFGRVFTSQLAFGMAERHMWLSLWERPMHSCFTRGQRVACSALVLHLYLALGTLCFGAVGTARHSGPVSAHLLVSGETVAMGMIIALLVFPLQCFLCFLFRKTHSQVTLDMSVPPSPVCQSVEMDNCHIQSDVTGPSFMFLPDSAGFLRDSSSSLQESKALNSSIMDFWTSSGLVPKTEGLDQKGVMGWSSCDSLLSLPARSCPSKTDHDLCKVSPTHQLKRKKAMIQFHLASPTLQASAFLSSTCSHSLSDDSFHFHNSSVQPSQKSPNLSWSPDPVQVYNHNKSAFLTLSEEDLLMSIAAADGASDVINSNSDSGRDSPRTMSSFSASRGASWSSCSEEQCSAASLYRSQRKQPDLLLDSSQYGAGFYKCSSELSMESVASTFLPEPLCESIQPFSTTRIGVARGQPTRLLPSWVLRVVYLLMALLIAACLAVVGLYGSLFSRPVQLMWLVSVLTAILTSIIVLEPLKVCVQALIYTALWRPVDPEVEELLAQETTVVRALGEFSGKVRPPCGYGLLQAKQEAHKIQALRSLMRHCVCHLLFMLLVLMVICQDRTEQSQARLLHSAIRQRLHTAPSGSPNLTSLKDWSDAEQWINHTLVPHLHQNPSLQLVGLPQLQFTRTLDSSLIALLGNNCATTHRLLGDMHIADTRKKQFNFLSIRFTHYHRESGLFMCVSIQLELTQTQGISSSLFTHPLLVLSSFSGLDLRVALTILLCISAFLIMSGELWSILKERSQYICQSHHWIQLLLAFLSLATAIQQLRLQSLSALCASKMQSEQDSFIDFHSAALQAERSSQCAAVLLTLLVLKMLGTLRFVRRWVMIGRVLQGTRRELLAVAVLVLLLLLICTHLGNMLFSFSVEGFQSVKQTKISVMSMLCTRRILQKLCRVHPVLGPLYGLLVFGGCIWFLARICGAVLICRYRETQAELFHLTVEPQDCEMVAFFIKRLKLWMGLTKPKQFRHRVKFEGMDIPPSRSSPESCFSTLSSLPSSRSPSMSSSFSSSRPPSSALSVRSEDLPVSKPSLDVQPYLDRLEPIFITLLSRFDRVNQLTEDIYNLEIQIEEVQERRRKRRINSRETTETMHGEVGKSKEPEEKSTTGEVRHRRRGLIHTKSRVSVPSLLSSSASSCSFPRVRSFHSESESVPFQSQTFSDVTTPTPAAIISGLNSNSTGQFPRRRAWHSGSSHSADAARRIPQSSGVAPNGGENLIQLNVRPGSEEEIRRCICDRLPLMRKAWICEGPESEEE